METQNTELTIKRAFADISRHNGNVIGDPNGELSFAYVRVSSSGQAEEGRSGLPRQLSNIHKKARDLNLRIPFELVYYDDHTGFEFRSRPGLQALLAEINRPDRAAYHIVIEYLDRLSRNAKWHQGFLLDLFAEHKVMVSFWKSFGSEVERAVMGAISEQGMRHEIERMTEGTRRKAESGRITAKTPSYGYLFTDSQGRPTSDPTSQYRKDTHYIPHPEESLIMVEIFQRIVGGESLYTICNDLNRRGVRTPKGSRCWETGNVSKVLKNPIYKGDYIANRFYNTKEWSERAQRMVRRQRIHPQEKWIIVSVTPLVSAKLWQDAQDALQRNLKFSTRKAKATYLLQGILRCARCGMNFTTASSHGTRDSPEKIKFYICGSRQMPLIFREKLSCNSPYIRAVNIEPHVWNVVCQVITNPDLIIRYMEQQTEKVVKGGLSDQLAYIEREIGKCEREETQWDRAFAEEIFDLKEYKDKKVTVAARKATLVEEQQRLRAELSIAQEFEQKKETIRQHLQSIRQLGFDYQIPLKDKRRILGLLVDQVIIDTNEQWFALEGTVKGTFRYGKNPNSEDELGSTHPGSRYHPGRR